MEGPPIDHTRSTTTEGPDYCAECSEFLREWVRWPCPSEVALRLLRGGEEDQ